MTSQRSQDRWADWLADRRHGGESEQLRRALDFLIPIRDQIIHNAALSPGQRILDVGCGDGLIGFGAADAVGPTGQVIFSDISADLLERCSELATEAGISDRCRFVQAPARDLTPIADQHVDAVTLRSVLIYERDKADSFAEFHRVLRPGGQLSLFEPINRFGGPASPNRFAGYDTTPVADLVANLRELYDTIQPPGSDPMVDFDEHDLVAFAEHAGFNEVHLRLHVDIHPVEARPWQTVLNSSPNPRVPTLAEAMSQTLTAEGAARLSNHLRPLIERGQGEQRMAVAYLWARRPTP